MKTATPDPPDEPGRIQAEHLMAGTLSAYNVRVAAPLVTHVQASTLHAQGLEEGLI